MISTEWKILKQNTERGAIKSIHEMTILLKELEKISNDIYINGGEEEDVPIWKNVLEKKGYAFDYVDEHENVTAFGTSSDWLKKEYPQITEHYCIENQPTINE